LGLVKDLRNHPVAPLIQEGFPIVISADDPGLWDAKGLSYDYYSAFMAMASKSMNLKLLKKLVQGSILRNSFSAIKFSDNIT
jgi:adenosine deaminase